MKYRCIDFYRYNESDTVKNLKRYPLEFQWLYYFRKLQHNNYNKFILHYLYKKLDVLCKITQIQIPLSTQIGEGLYIGHTGRVIINENSILGKNINIATGVTIGIENRGERKGCPIIDDNVWIGTNSVIVGNIHIGTDVLIAPLTFVNFDVPDHSIVIGNPAKVIYKLNATAGYINRTV